MEQQKIDFISEVLEANMPFCAICQKYQISRKTGYKWYSRFKEEGKKGLGERSRAPLSHPSELDKEVVSTVLLIKQQYKFWGPRKIHARFKSHYPDLILPSKSSIENILKANSLTCTRTLRRRVPLTAPLSHCTRVNDIWSCDFKGWFLTGDGKKCEPLTISDAHSRYLLKCVHMKRKRAQDVWEVFDSAFREYGLPLAMRSDNGPPFATTGVGRLSRLSIMLLKAGVSPEWITPGKPEENGRHERMHLTLKNEIASPPAQTLSAQLRLLSDFQHYYNYERPHEALDQQVPASVFSHSPREWDGKLRAPEYDDLYEKRKVMKCGCIGWLGTNYFLSESLYGEYVGLKPRDNGIFDVKYGSIYLGEIDVRKGFRKDYKSG